MSTTMIRSWTLCCVVLVASMGAPGGGTTVLISWPGEVTAGYPTTFTCDSSCISNCIYTMSFRGETFKGTSLTWTPDGQDFTVKLKCNVNSPDPDTSGSTTAIIEVKNEMFVQIHPQDTIPSPDQPLNLVCGGLPSSDPEGPSDLVWYKDGQKVTLRENMQLLRNNQTLHFESALPSDAGFYRCQTRLPTRQVKVFSLGFQLSFVPWNVSISGPDVIYTGELSEFFCLTSCTLNVECTIKWQFRGGFPVGHSFSINGNHIKWVPSLPGTFQNFTCIAENKASGQSAEHTKMVAVIDVPVSGSEAMKLSGLSVLVCCSLMIYRAVSFVML
ncbi:uncharacterized protein [Nothobranchius furzeri]|uniref:LOC107379522-like protein n=2 Tax=Nothobranchius furzeri TaxID=105023 RepID=A0A9D3BY26_NOTFU|nr:uncharacterized protein LOC107379522 [Nothobranchius furzeri]KAF7227047.1 putative LOC107379522-like protein [Nothobranchius furzeri]